MNTSLQAIKGPTCDDNFEEYNANNLVYQFLQKLKLLEGGPTIVLYFNIILFITKLSSINQVIKIPKINKFFKGIISTGSNIFSISKEIEWIVSLNRSKREKCCNKHIKKLNCRRVFNKKRKNSAIFF